MTKSIFQDGDTVLVAFGNIQDGIILKPGFVFQYVDSGYWNYNGACMEWVETGGQYPVMKIMTYTGFMDCEDSIGFWKTGKHSATRLVLTEKSMEKKKVFTKEEVEMYKEIYREIYLDGLYNYEI